MSQQHKEYSYKFYPTLLDAFHRYTTTNEENFFYQDDKGKWHCNYDGSTGEYQYSPSEVEEMAKKELIDKINRVRIYSLAASKGTVFNELVDCVIEGRKSESLHTERLHDTTTGELIAIRAVTEDGEVFDFEPKLLSEAGKYFKGCLSQIYTEAPLETKYGRVMLYGYIDELKGDMIYDIKTTNSYQFGKYEHYWQRHLYPYCLEESGMMEGIKGFEFTCYVLSGGTSRTPIIKGKQYPEFYNYSYKQSKEMLTQQCERFIEFIEANKDLITDEKIFARECFSQSA